MSKTILLASNNQAKLTELQATLQHLNISLKSQRDLALDSVEETGLSFVENALIKARYGAHHAKLASIADDSGLVVTSLGGRPGIYSSRFAGPRASDDDNIDCLLEQMQGIENRAAYFFCAMVYVSHANDPTPLIATGIMRGEILQARRGSHGFGYDPVFFIPSLNKTTAELTAETKNKLSHRALASQSLVKQLTHELT